MQQNPKQAEAPRSKVRKVQIDSEQAGQRIDNFLRRELPGVPKGRIYRMLRRGEVRVNGVSGPVARGPHPRSPVCIRP